MFRPQIGQNSRLQKTAKQQPSAPIFALQSKVENIFLLSRYPLEFNIVLSTYCRFEYKFAF